MHSGVSSLVRGIPFTLSATDIEGRSVLACMGPSGQGPSSFSSIRSVLACTGAGVSTRVWGDLNEVRENRSLHSRVGRPLSEPLQNQGSASSRGQNTFGLPYKRGYGRLAAVSFKPDTTMTAAA